MRFLALATLVALASVACTQITEVDWTKVPAQTASGGDGSAGTNANGIGGAVDVDNPGAAGVAGASDTSAGGAG